MAKQAKKKQHSAPPKPHKATAKDWIAGARVRTLSVAIAPVAVGAGAASVVEKFSAPLTLLCLLVALALQIGVNFANDYSDGIRGTDKYRVGPARLTGSGAAPAKKVLAVALSFFAVAGLAGIAIVILTGLWWILAVGAVCIVAAWFYTGGRRPYGYAGLGEVVVFIFFGLVATLGTTYVQALAIPLESWLGAIGVGLLACAVLVVNNIRDIETDKQAGKRTLAVLMGPIISSVFYTLLMLAPFGIAIFFTLLYPAGWVILFALLLAIPACVITVMGKTPSDYILALKISSLTVLYYGLSLAWVLFQ